jgi:hypothetical protein
LSRQVAGDREALLGRGIDQSIIECHEGQRARVAVGARDRGRKLERVGGAERVGAQ